MNLLNFLNQNSLFTFYVSVLQWEKFWIELYLGPSAYSLTKFHGGYTLKSDPLQI